MCRSRFTPAKTYDPSDPADSEYFEFALFMARREYKAITRRMQAGREASAREGNWLAAPPYGYTKVRNQRGRGMTLAIREDEADVVRMVFETVGPDGGAVTVPTPYWASRSWRPANGPARSCPSRSRSSGPIMTR